MVSYIEIFFREIRRWFSRSEWLIRVLGLPISKDSANSAGLIIIQIDGLSRPQLEKGIKNNKLPFIKKMLKDEHYWIHSLYTGAPSSTPSVQGELFYGVKSIVPAFSFYDKTKKKVQTMYEPNAAHSVESELAKQGIPLLTNGSAYCNVYGAGAEEPHFCASSFGWGGVLRAANPFVLLFFLITNIYSFARTISLIFLELIIALFDFFDGFINGKDFLKELKFIPTRVVICILLRELVTIGAKIDIARGLPIIHLNLLGYDEQAHRRGPSSKFAHWTLKGIDDSIKRLWKAAHHSSRRHYDLWIYSDHGQEDVTPYQNLYGRTIENAISNVFKSNAIGPLQSNIPHGIQTQRARFLGGTFFQKLFATYSENNEIPDESEPIITAMGPLGLIYSPKELDTKDKILLADKLIEKAYIPVVLFTDEKNNVIAKTKQNTFNLPRDGEKLFGLEHPFLEEITQDITNICLHKYAGDFIFLGWHKDTEYITFRIENGSHAGPGPNETHAFAVLPKDAIFSNHSKKYLRAIHLRNAAKHHLINNTKKTFQIPKRKIIDKRTLRIMTYNIHSCIGMDGKVYPERIARVIARYHPDVVCLQELDVKKFRTHSIDQAHYLAKLLKMKFHFHPTVHIEEERYGDAILTHLPMKLVKSDILSTPLSKYSMEPRGALWIQLTDFDLPINIINTHLDIRKNAREQQLDLLLSSDWIGHPECNEPLILCGDFNAFPSSIVYKKITNLLHDTQIKSREYDVKPTFFTRFPTARIDYIFVDNNIDVKNTIIPNSALTRIASDHFPLIADILV